MFDSKFAAAVGLRQSKQTGAIACLIWGILTVLFFVVGLLVGEGTSWFVVVASLLKVGAFLMSAALCWRNASNPEIVSGRSVWQAIAVGMLCHALGDTVVILWRSLWGMTVTVALGDLFYGVSYLFLAIGLLQAVLPRQMILSLKQTLGISIAGVVGILFASWISFYSPKAISLTGTLFYEPAVETAVSSVSSLQQANSKSAAAGTVAKDKQQVPAIVETIEQRLGRLTKYSGLVYVVGDCVLVVMAAALLVAFWGGSYSQTWRLVAMAGLCLYIADMFLIYEIGRGSYQQGAFWEIFWVFSALFFGLSAGVEQGISEQMQTRASRREWL